MQWKALTLILHGDFLSGVYSRSASMMGGMPLIGQQGTKGLFDCPKVQEALPISKTFFNFFLSATRLIAKDQHKFF